LFEKKIDFNKIVFCSLIAVLIKSKFGFAHNWKTGVDHPGNTTTNAAHLKLTQFLQFSFYSVFFSVLVVLSACWQNK